jgi:hypothetical protein
LRTLPNIEDEGEIKKAAFAYLTALHNYDQIDPPIRFPRGWLPALGPTPPNASDPKFDWLPIGWPVADAATRDAADPFQSFRAKRTSSQHQTIVLFAGEKLNGQFIGSGFGLRVIMHAGPLSGGRFQLRITGVTGTFPPEGATAIYDDVVFARGTPLVRALFDPDRLRRAKTALNLSTMQLRGFRITPTPDDNIGVERRAWGLSTIGDGDLATPYVLVYRELWSKSGDLLEDPVVIHRTEFVADATPGRAKVFLRDPASRGGSTDVSRRRPTRSEQELNAYRTEVEIGGPALQFPPGPVAPAGNRLVVVVCPLFVRDDLEITPGTPKYVHLPNTDPDQPPVRSDDFSAVSALFAVRDLFVRLDAYGLLATDYFRIAKLPLEVSYRSGVRPGPGKDGQTVNAWVRVRDWDDNVVGPTPGGMHPTVDMHLALANLSHRARSPWDGMQRAPAEPVGIAADARWIWHEIGHVLLMASVGELELRFAHSPGDALAAIIADPDSKLAVPSLDPDYPEARGRTFPWVFVPRRHDRRTSRGWSWCGCLHRDLAEVPESEQPRRKGYWSEQILSSSLFRLYRCLGGDTIEVANRAAVNAAVRRSASHYSVYLIMRGLQLLGTCGIQLGNNPDQFVSVLMQADEGTDTWDVEYPLKSDETTLSPPQVERYERVGGCAIKVIRWAFEAQGLYAAPGQINNGPGLPPPVDVYIPDDRGTAVPTPDDFAPGNYAPVSLDWDPDQSGAGPRPAWQASDAGIRVQGINIHVTVANRGSQPATDVEVSVWICPWPANASPPKWEFDPQDPGNGPWQLCTPPIVIANVGPNNTDTQTASFSHTPPTGRYIVLAQASCPDDRANTDRLTTCPCSELATPLRDLVPNDNNLGLRVVGP